MSAPTDRELWEASCLTRYQLNHWTDDDFRSHIEGVRHTVRHLLWLLDGSPTIGADGRTCSHHDDDPAHGKACYHKIELRGADLDGYTFKMVRDLYGLAHDGAMPLAQAKARMQVYLNTCIEDWTEQAAKKVMPQNAGTIRNTRYVVSYGYAGSQMEFTDEAEAVAYWRTQAKLTSYVNPAKFQPAAVHRVVTLTEEITPAGAAP